MNKTVGDIIASGTAALGEDLHAHIAAGAGDESTLDANVDALRRAKLVSRVAAGVGTPSTAATVLGLRLDIPVLTAPMGPVELIDPAGARAIAEGAGQARAGTTVAMTSAPVLEQVIPPDTSALFQLYWWGDRPWIQSMLDRAAHAGFSAVVITVDAPDYGTRWVDVRNGFDHHGQMALPNLLGTPSSRTERLAYQQALTFSDIAWAVEASPIPVVVKGVLSGADARRAIDSGVAAIYVSNHGGRALAGQIGTLDALLEVSAEAKGEVPLIVDGAFRTGEDVAKGIACGASLVAIGRPIAYALADGGAKGVANYLGLLTEDLRTALTVLGAQSPAALGPEHIRLTGSL